MNIKNRLTKQIEKDKKMYMSKILSHKRKKWKVLNHAEEEDDETPTRIAYNGEVTSSQRKIGEIFG